MQTTFVIKMKDGYLAANTAKGLVITESLVETKQYKNYANAFRFAKRYKAEAVLEVVFRNRHKQIAATKLL